jgi:hypothetical protein
MKQKGAKTVAGLVADAIKTDVPELAKYLKGEETFDDISGHWGEAYIKALAKEGLVDGEGNGKFNPNGTVTRAEFLKMAMDATRIVGHAYREGECLDAANDDWYCYYLQGALDKNLIPEAMIENCTSEKVTKTLAEATDESEAVTTDVTVYTGEFNGDTPITREEMAAIAMSCVEYSNRNSNDWDVTALRESLSDFDEVNSDYLRLVKKAYDLEYINGMGDGTFAPKSTLTRAQAAVVISKMANLVK